MCIWRCDQEWLNNQDNDSYEISDLWECPCEPLKRNWSCLCEPIFIYSYGTDLIVVLLCPPPPSPRRTNKYPIEPVLGWWRWWLLSDCSARLSPPCHVTVVPPTTHKSCSGKNTPQDISLPIDRSTFPILIDTMTTEVLLLLRMVLPPSALYILRWCGWRVNKFDRPQSTISNNK